jgi:hypothetical protein
MIDRRDVLKTGAAASLALGVPTALRAAPRGVSLWVSDPRFELGVQPIAAPHAVALADGDVTPLWTRTLDDAWRGRGFVVAGATGSDALFVLEQLAWHRGRRVTERSEIQPGEGRRPALVRWLIAPVHPSVTA